MNGTTFSGANLFPDQFMASGAALAPVQTTFFAKTGDIVDGAGIFEGGDAFFNGTVDGQKITVQEIVWFDPNGSTSFSSAESQGFNTGGSVLTTVRLAAGIDINIVDMSSVPGFVVGAPEPSTFALSTICAAALIISRRRRK